MAKVFSIGGSTISYGGFLLRELGEGSLTISKTVSGSGFDPTKTFELTVVFSAPVTYNGTTSTTHVFNLAHGQSVTITGIPELTEYEVTETPLSQADKDLGYLISGITGGRGIVQNGGSHTAAASNLYELPLPARTIRVQFANLSYNPNSESYWSHNPTWTQVSANPNIWDATTTDTSWDNLFYERFKSGTTGDTYVLKANSTGITRTDLMFLNCPALKSVALFDTSDVTNMGMMFYGCRGLQTIPFFDTSNVIYMQEMFEDCSSLISIPELDTSKVRTMEAMFWGCTNLVSVPLLDTSSVTQFVHMFADCTSIQSLPLFNMSAAYRADGMCNGCSNLRAIPSWDVGPNVINVSGMMANCDKVESGILDLYTNLSNRASVPRTHGGCFKDCGKDSVTGAAELAQIPSDWK